MTTSSRFSRNIYAIGDRIWCNKHLRHTTTEKYGNNGKGVQDTSDLMMITTWAIDMSFQSPRTEMGQLNTYNPIYCNENTLRQKQNDRHFADGVSKCISLNLNFWILNKVSLKYVPQGLINNMAALVQIMAWHRHWRQANIIWTNAGIYRRIYASVQQTSIYVTWPQWVKWIDQNPLTQAKSFMSSFHAWYA